MQLQPLFPTPILIQTVLDPGYSGHANDVWRVVTQHETVVVRMQRAAERTGPFWAGCQALFGNAPDALFDLEPINATVARFSPLPIPQVLRKGMLDERPYVIVEHLPGTQLQTFSALPDHALEDFGRALAHIHTPRFHHYGPITGTTCYDPSTFHWQVAQTVSLLVEQFYQHDLSIKTALGHYVKIALALPPPQELTLVMIDIDTSQCLTDGKRVTAIVDTEAYVIGPRALDFIGLEYLLTPREAAVLARGYSSVLPLPDLSAVRPLYRYLYRLLGVQGSVPLDVWMDQPAIF